MAKAGRPSKLKPDMLKDAEVLAGLGFTEENFCTFWHISSATLNRWKRKNGRELQTCIERGRDSANISVTKACLQRAISGNMTAIIFWLTNRCPELWRDKQPFVNNNTNIVNVQKAGGNGKFIGEDSELQKRIERDLSALLPK